MLLIYGGNGWIVKKIVDILESIKTPFLVSTIRADDIKAVEEEIKTVKPTNIMCLLGRTHGTFEGEYIPTIDYLEKKGKVKENVRDNLFCPVALALLCKKYDIHLTYLGTGCIFTYTDGKRIFTEEDEPNFFGSSYSVVKGYTDRLMHMFDNVLNVRIRMPISSDTSPRNFIVKLLKYEKICSMQNSMTVLDELLPIMCDMSLNKEIGTVNLTNPGTIEHSEILDMYREIVDPTFTYNLFSYEDQMKVIACDRSNNELDTVVLSSKYGVKNIKESVRDILNSFKIRCKIISYSSKGYEIGKGDTEYYKDFKYTYDSSNNISETIMIESEKDTVDWVCYVDPTRILKKSITMIADPRYSIICFYRDDKTIDTKFLLVNLKHPITKKFFEVLDSIQNFSKLLSVQSNLDYVKFIPSPESYFVNDSKILWREFCCDNLEYLKLINLPTTFSERINCVLVEFRKLQNVEFVVRNCMNKLREKCSYTIVCGNDNYEFMLDISRRLDNKVQIIKFDITNPSVNDYNNLLLSTKFWESLNGEYVLIYQEDTCIFKDNIEDFLEFDYIGAPWPECQKENINNTGNGGFSLRRRTTMIEVLKLNISIDSLKLSENCKGYMNVSKLKNAPEDVYFSNALINHNIGKVADLKSASSFSQELVKSDNPLGGHNWWLYEERFLNNPHIFEYDFSKIFKCVGVTSPYPFTLGGGEKYLSHIMKYFISTGYIVCLYTISDFNTVQNTLKLYLNQEELKWIKLHKHSLLFKENMPEKIMYEYFIQMNNSAVPYTKGIGKFNIYHCQFPHEAGKDIDFFKDSFDIIKSYDLAIVNSEFTQYNLQKIYKGLIPIKIIYPPCFETMNKEVFLKHENTFVMVGRIFEYDLEANNKYFDVAIDAFNKFDGKLTIIGSVKSLSFYNKLLGMITDPDRIRILTDIDDNAKIEILKETKYYIQLTGMLDNFPCNQEHFGISLIEALNYGCIPICFNGGYAPYILNENNGYLVNTSAELSDAIINLTRCLDPIDLTNFTDDKFKEMLTMTFYNKIDASFRFKYYIGDFLENTPHYIKVDEKYKKFEQNGIFFYNGPHIHVDMFPYHYGTLSPGWWWGENGGFSINFECLATGADGYICDNMPVLTKARSIGEKGIIYKAEYNRHWGIFENNFQDANNFEDKINEPIWRGVHCTGCWKKANRRLFVSKYYDKYNIGFSSQDINCSYYEENKYLFKGNLSINDMLKYKYLICIEGNDVSTGLKWMLASNSVVLMPKPTIESWLMEGLLEPYKHYIPLKDDFSDLDEILNWCKSNDDKCKKISENAKNWMKQFMNKAEELQLHNKIISWYKKNINLK